MTNADIADFVARIALKAWGAGVIDNADLATALRLEAAFRNPESDAAPKARQGVEIERNGTGAAFTGPDETGGHETGCFRP